MVVSDKHVEFLLVRVQGSASLLPTLRYLNPSVLLHPIFFAFHNKFVGDTFLYLYVGL